MCGWPLPAIQQALQRRTRLYTKFVTKLLPVSSEAPVALNEISLCQICLYEDTLSALSERIYAHSHQGHLNSLGTSVQPYEVPAQSLKGMHQALANALSLKYRPVFVDIPHHIEGVYAPNSRRQILARGLSLNQPRRPLHDQMHVDHDATMQSNSTMPITVNHVNSCTLEPPQRGAQVSSSAIIHAIRPQFARDYAAI